MNNIRQTANSLKPHLSPCWSCLGRAGSWVPHQRPRWQDTLSFGAAIILHWFPLLSLANLLCTCAMLAWLSLPAQKSTAQPTGSLPAAELQTKQQCALVHGIHCVPQVLWLLGLPWVPNVQFMWGAESTASPALSSSPNNNKMHHSLCVENGWNSNAIHTWDTATWWRRVPCCCHQTLMKAYHTHEGN